MLKVKFARLPLRGYHVYKKTLKEQVKRGEKLQLQIETTKFQGTSTFPVAAVRCKDGNSEKIGTIPKDYSWCFKVILRAGWEIFAEVANENPVWRDWEYGEEIICDFFFSGEYETEIRQAFHNLQKVLKDPCWGFFNPRIYVEIDNPEESLKWEESESLKVDGVQDAIPEELENDPLTRQLYEKAIKDGKENDRSIRVMVIGCYGQGKTSLVKNLFQESVDGIASTNGIDVIQFEVKGNNWNRNDTHTDAVRRLVSVVHSTPSSDMEQDEDDNVGNSGDFEGKTDDATDGYKAKNNQKRKGHEDMTSVLNTYGDCPENKKRKSQGTISLDDREKTKKAAEESPSQLVNETQKPISKSSSGMLKEFSSAMKKSSEKDFADITMTGTIWDFGGQFIFYSTHQLFHSRQAIYLLVFDLSKGLDASIKDTDFPNQKDEKTQKDYIKFWINSVHCFVGSENGEEPQIILVGTHVDKVDPDQDVDECFDSIRKLFEDSKLFNHIYPQHFAISNIEPDSKEVLKLKNIITELGKDMSEKKSPIPARWIPLEKSLKEKQQKITTFENVWSVNNENEFPVKDKDEIKLFLQFHHTRGRFCYFDDGELSQHVVLNPQYLIDAFRCIVTSKKFCRVKRSLRNSWNSLCEDAILLPDLIEVVWGKDSEEHYLEHKEILLAFLKRHGIISEVQRYSETENELRTPEPLGYYIVPSLLKTRRSARLVSCFIDEKQKTEASLVYRFEYDSIVQTIYQRVTAAALAKWPPIEFDRQKLLYENLSVFELVLDHAGMIFYNEDKLELLVINLTPPENISKVVCDSFRCFFEAVVSVEFQKLRASDSNTNERKLYTNLLRCFHRTHGMYGSNNLHDMKRVQQGGRPKVRCPDNLTHCLNVTDVMNEWFNDEIDAETVPKRTLSDKECSTLATAIGKGWELLAYQLGFSKVQVDHIRSDFTRTAIRVFEVLTDWCQEHGEEATLDVLVAAIRKIPKKHLKVDMDKLKKIIHGIG
ncbi:uncharacterized protein LOC123536632 isoform X2 [Mercenaria mercenaria]|nr:uncharacterized protein LOC123536632 isoform X2 [Mercenaria mercenaria]